MAPDPDFPAEMGNIPYSDIIGAPLNAAVEANADASVTAAEFIRDVGFEDNSDFIFSGTSEKPVNVTFTYTKKVYDDDGAVEERDFEMQIPLLLLLHVPYFEVETVTIDFNVKLNSIHQKQVTTDTEGQGGGRLRLFGSRVRLGGSVSRQKTEKRSQQIKRSYDQSVHVEAGSIEPPEGVSRLFDILEQTIVETPEDE